MKSHRVLATAATALCLAAAPTAAQAAPTAPAPSPTSAAPSAPPTAGAAPTTKVRGDLDGDGFGDELIIPANGSMWRWHTTRLGNTQVDRVSGDFSTITWIGSSGDMNGDGYQDVEMRVDNGDLVITYGDGTGNFPTGIKIGVGWNQMDPQKLFAMTNFLGGGPAILAVNTTNCNLYRYGFNAQHTAINSVAVIGTGWCEMRQVFSNGDNNGDGISDIVGIHQNGDYLVYTGTSAGTIGGGPFKKGNGWFFDKVTAPGDLTGDGYDDVLAVTSAGEVYQYPTGPNNTWGPRTLFAKVTSPYVME